MRCKGQEGINERRRTTLCGDDTSLTERIAQKLKVGLLEEALSGTLGVRAVSDDNIELVLALLEELETIANVDLDVGVLEANAHARKVLLGDTDDSLRNHEPDIHIHSTSTRGFLFVILPHQCRTGWPPRRSRA